MIEKILKILVNIIIKTVLFYFYLFLVTLYLLPDLHGVFVIGVPIYVVVITTMLWRAIARVQFFEVSSLRKSLTIHTVIYFQDLWTWSKLCTCAGGFLFSLSDLIIGIDRFKYNIDYAQASIPFTTLFPNFKKVKQK